MKLAVTIIPGSGRISPVFETAEHLWTIRICRNGACSVIAQNRLPEKESEKIAFLCKNGIRLLICGALCNETREELEEFGIRVIPFVSGDWKAVAAAALNQSERFPENYIMPGCCIQHRKCCQHQGEKTNEDCIDKSGR
jgi:predicted Fe-Mo cluster-binding NifX family protein